MSAARLRLLATPEENFVQPTHLRTVNPAQSVPKIVPPASAEFHQVLALAVQFPAVVLRESVRPIVEQFLAVTIDRFEPRFQFRLMRLHQAIHAALNFLQSLRVVMAADHVRGFDNDKSAVCGD